MASDMELIERKIDQLVAEKVNALMAEKLDTFTPSPSVNTSLNQNENDRTNMEAHLHSAVNMTHCEQPWQMIAEKFECAAREQDLDIYQMCAWIVKREDIGIRKRTQYLFYMKALICAIIQGPGLAMFIYVQFAASLKADAGFCNQSSSSWDAQEADSIYVHTLVVMFSMYISAKMGGIIHDIGESGLYNIDFRNGAWNCPPFCARGWAMLGGYMNICAIFFTIYGSFIVLYLTDDILDVVLNSVALFFAMDIDNYMLNHADHMMVINWLDDKYNVADWDGMEPMQPFYYALTKYFLTPIGFALTAVGILTTIVAPWWLVFCH